MGIFPFFKKKEFFTADEKERIVEAIRLAEIETSGEVRVFVESKNPFMDPIDRAAEIFFKLKMQDTKDRNGVIVYVATKHKELALFGDEGIHKAVGSSYWNDEVKKMIALFSTNNVCEGMVQCIRQIGQTLKEKFPYSPTDDKNELSDDIVFGR